MTYAKEYVDELVKSRDKLRDQVEVLTAALKDTQERLKRDEILLEAYSRDAAKNAGVE